MTTVLPKPTATATTANSLKVRKCATAQDGHSAAEERLYNALWRQARPESAETRLISVGWDLMASMCGLTWKNARANCFRLIEKLAIERVHVHDSDRRVGTTYRIYSYRAIVDRRKAAGLEWMVRNRGGVVFVSPPTTTTVPVTPMQTGGTVPTVTTGTVVTET